MNVYMVRHGETDWNRAGRYQGQRESSLTEIGILQAEALGRAFSVLQVKRVISSPLRRCTETALPVACGHGLPLETDARLLEIAHGNWEGRLRNEIERDDPQTMRQWREAPQTVHFEGGESLADVRSRWKAFANGLVGKDDVVLVTHDVLVRLAILDATGGSLAMLWEAQVRNGAYARFAVDAGSWKLLDECCDVHLDGLRVDPTFQAL